MAGSIYGKLFRISTWGESHGKGVGVVVDGCPAGLELSEEDIQKYLNRRRPGQSKFTTPRKEEDAVEILSGVFDGKTTGAPISMVVFNHTQRSGDYAEIASSYRPGHADYTFDCKYGFRDYRGGGRSSARETIARVAAGAVAAKILEQLGISVDAYTKSIGSVCISKEHFSLEERFHNPVCMPDASAAEQAQKILEEKMQEQDSVGGVVECKISHLKAGIGEPVFDKLDARLAHAMLSIGAAKGFEIGEGFHVSEMAGSENNDSFYMKNGSVAKTTNHSGGVLGGISDGSEVVFRVAFKPTPSIFRTQKTVNKDGEEIEMNIRGRHDPVVVPRAVVVVECMAAICVLDALLESMLSTMHGIQKFFEE